MGVRTANPDDAAAIARVHVASSRRAYRGIFSDAKVAIFGSIPLECSGQSKSEEILSEERIIMAELMRLAHGYCNGTCVVDGVVEKRHLGPSRRAVAAREVAVLRSLQGVLPVPEVLRFDPDEPLLCIEMIEGENGQALVEQDLADEVLFQCGILQRRIAEVDASEMVFLALGDQLVHGDYGPHNILFSPDGSEVLGIVDWEWSRRGNPIDDLAWAEWVIRIHHPDQISSIPALFEGSGLKPPWEDRHKSMLANCGRGLERAEARGNEKYIASWHTKLGLTRKFRNSEV